VHLCARQRAGRVQKAGCKLSCWREARFDDARKVTPTAGDEEQAKRREGYGREEGGGAHGNPSDDDSTGNRWKPMGRRARLLGRGRQAAAARGLKRKMCTRTTAAREQQS